MTSLFLLEPEPTAAWFPFADSRPIAELRAGSWLIRERWEAVSAGEATAIFGPPHLSAFVEDGVPQVSARHAITGPAIVGRSDFAPEGDPLPVTGEARRLTHGGTTVGWSVPDGAAWEGEHDEWPEAEIAGVQLHGAWDLVETLEHFLPADTVDFTREPGDALPDGSIVIGDPADIVLLGARVEPGVVFDTRSGVIVLEQHSYIKSGARLEGPLYVGPGSEILGGPVSQCSIGPRCKVRGEVTRVVFLGFANKAHSGFVGDSVIGRWANLGANTVTSNLKNTYGPVRIELPGERIETGRQFLGSLIGDHAKTAIGTLLNTGTVIGVGANVVASGQPPKYVPPFTWAKAGTLMNKGGFLEVAARVLPRRNVEFTDEVREMLDAIYTYATAR